MAASAVSTPPRLSREWFAPLVLFCLGHFFVDLYSSALAVFQPLLVEHYRLSFTQAGILGGLLAFSSSVMQPLYGFLSDRFHSPLFTTLAPAVAGIFISGLGLAPSYAALLLMVWLGGVGIASFHPQATANATYGMEAKRGRAMAIFICSGTLGFAVGPPFFSIITGWRGLHGAAWGAIPGIAVSVLLVTCLRRLPAAGAGARVRMDWAPLRAVWKPLSILYFLVVIRSIVQVVFAQMLPLYLHTQRGYTLKAASYTLSAYLLGGAIGGIAGGNLADRFGGRFVILLSMIGSVPFLALFLLTNGVLSALGLFLGGLLLLFTIPVNVLMAQELAPSQAGVVSALMMGFGWGMAGLIFIPLTGWISDVVSMQAAFTGLICFPALGFLLALKLPK
jgi:FSR family fosmidomycin resistance protein-like MFS transporter